MELTFNSQDEFEAFARIFVAGVAVRDNTQTIINAMTINDTRAPEAQQSAAGPAPQPDDGNDDGLTHEHIDLPDAEPSDEAPAVAPVPGVETKRKRRTKAEIEAERLAAEAGKVDPSSQVQEPLTDAQTDAVQPDATPEPVKTPDAPTQPLGASPEALAKVAEARAAYTPELIEELKAHADLFEPNRLEHMNEAREAISKKGFIPYNATMHGLGLASSIATYTDAEVKLHRAAIAHLLAS